ncbi:ATP-binding protein [Sulfuriferula nivalis]|uniref:histidine kinase n=1 Tax=Sulfuriferula nivalis TaxID=2675298 RepID=A0A809SA46_9PROT|nr:ATP-binding protein [Sulfuriferula nivalis]BBP01743.1 two-component sensor histidine kinase [Sulfuriferula nivalis]
MKSLKKQLIFWLVGLLTLAAVMAGSISFYFAWKEASSLLDQQLSEIASSVDEGSQLPAMQSRFERKNAEEKKQGFIIQVWIGNESGRSSRPDFKLPRAATPGFSDIWFRGLKWRAYTMIYPDRTVQIAQQEDVRYDIALHSAMRVLFPFALVIPISWLLIGVVVSRLLQPLERVTNEVKNRDVTSQALLPVEDVPQEVAPLVLAMNDLIVRLSAAIELQRQFLSDAAHELRTPLAALQLQIENLSQSHSRDDLDNRIEEMRRGSQRASHLVGQLLKISRYEAQGKSAMSGRIHLNTVVKACLADFIPLADHRHIDLGMTQDDDAMIMGVAEDMRVLLGNLIDNAIRYTPEGGKVDVSLRVANQEVVVEVLDTGSGIPESLLPRIFDRFFRVAGQETEGSGIGLSIVQAIAQRQSARVVLANRQDGHGLSARVIFSLAV